MADVTYNPSSFPSLVRTLAALLLTPRSASKKPPLLLLGYKQRDPAERTLWALVKDAVPGLEWVRIGARNGASAPGGKKNAYEPEGRGPVEVWLGRITPTSGHPT